MLFGPPGKTRSPTMVQQSPVVAQFCGQLRIECAELAAVKESAFVLPLPCLVLVCISLVVQLEKYQILTSNSRELEIPK